MSETMRMPYAARVAALDSELETERMRLAACSSAALGNIPTSVAQRITRDNPYWSASYGDVCRAVDAEIDYRERVAALEHAGAAFVAEVRAKYPASGHIGAAFEAFTALLAATEEK